ncbi:MAG: 3-deoxy-7-phosphoheptulonate synthase [Myxococcales bacterium]|nr:3-deoxy-7-phosphoheptulonate synthase [Myxococcales bacterium]
MSMATVVTLTSDADARLVTQHLQSLGVWSSALKNNAGSVTALTLSAHSASISFDALKRIPGIAEVLAAPSGHPRLDERRGKAVQINDTTKIGPGQPPTLMAGPCSAESAELVDAVAAEVAAAGGHLLRGGAFKPRTSPYAFAGAGQKALTWLRDAADRYGLGLVTECMSEADAGRVSEVADLIQIGSRNMQNFSLLRAIGATGAAVMLKRGRSATLSEWRLAAEHLLAAGARDVVFCERGIQGVDGETRNTLDLGAVALLSHIDQLPIVVDPSHGAGRRDLVQALSRAALAAGAHGVLVETHISPGEARSDGPQALPVNELYTLLRDHRN